MGLAAKLFAQSRLKASVHLDGGELAHGGQQVFGERAEAGADFQHLVRCRKVARLDDSAQHILIVQQILPKRLGKPNGFLVKRLTDVGAVHLFKFLLEICE